MSPITLIETTHLYNRAGITRHSHFRLKPSRLLAFVRKLFAARRQS
ncbi:hypothetical protein [Paraburkholderia sp. HP33-1]|nr:hypothetical protein [Paraburkholderia sp. HP33-1]